MEYIKIGQQLNIQRSNGRIHPVVVTSKNLKQNSITGEWTEGSISKGKDISLSAVVALNAHIFNERKMPSAGNDEVVAAEQSEAETYQKPGAINLYTDRFHKKVEKVMTRNLMTARNAKPSLGGRLSSSGAFSARAPCRSSSPLAGGLGTQRKSSVINCSSVVREVERMKEERVRRRAWQAEQRQEKTALMRKDPNNPNWEVALMVRKYRDTLVLQPLRSLSPRGARVQQITVCVRKRPMSRRELTTKNVDIISVPGHDSLIVHELRHKVDLTKFLEHHKFRFDYTFDEDCTNELVYEHTARPLIRTMFEGGNATCFAYGQTGSGKTHTMGGEFKGKMQDCSTGIYALAARDVFVELNKPDYRNLGADVSCSFFEIYGTKVFDLLRPDKPMLRVLEDGRQQVVVVGLNEIAVNNVQDVLRLIELGNRERTSGKTSANAKSSRSHAVFQMSLHLPNTSGAYGKCSFVDLAGNERGADTNSANRQTRIEGAEINKSLLALKECIRALSRQSSHLPFRGSKLTQVLRDSFIGGEKNRTCMIAMISPGLSSVEHTLNTLRYADRVKELVAKDDDVRVTYEPAPLADEPEPEDMDEESEPDEPQHTSSSDTDEDEGVLDQEPSQDDDSHITISSEEDSSPKTNDGSSVRQPIKLSQVIVQHRVLNEFLENFVRDFKELETHSLEYNPRLAKYVQNADPTFHELTTLVNYTSDLVKNFNAQRVIAELMNKNADVLTPEAPR